MPNQNATNFSYAELGTAQPQLVLYVIITFSGFQRAFSNISSQGAPPQDFVAEDGGVGVHSPFSE